MEGCNSTLRVLWAGYLGHNVPESGLNYKQQILFLALMGQQLQCTKHYEYATNFITTHRNVYGLLMRYAGLLGCLLVAYNAIPHSTTVEE